MPTNRRPPLPLRINRMEDATGNPQAVEQGVLTVEPVSRYD